MTEPLDRSEDFGRDVLLIFLKAPRLGTVKTRLIPALGVERSTAVYRRLAEETVARTGGSERPWTTRICVSPDDAGQEVSAWLGPLHRLRPQGTGDLGARLSRAFDDAFAAGARRVAVIGTDAPDLSAADVAALFAALDAVDVAVSPAADGGYAGLALRSRRPELFTDMPWSTARVCAETLTRAHAAALRTAALRTVRDVDEPADWAALADDVRARLLR